MIALKWSTSARPGDSPGRLIRSRARMRPRRAIFRSITEVATLLKDAELGPGWSYYVEETAYMEHVVNYKAKKEVRHTFFLSLLAVLELTHL